MNWREEYKPFLWIFGFFIFFYFMPLGVPRFDSAIFEAFALLKWYAKKHVILCLIPAFFIAGVIAVFISQDAVLKYFGANAKKWISYAVASVSGTVLAVCSCTILPLFAGIYKRGAGLGPAVTFLYAGPAINILAIILTARILGIELGMARIIGAVIFAVIIGLTMHGIYHKEESNRADSHVTPTQTNTSRPFWQTAFHFFVLVFIMVFATWGKTDQSSGIWYLLFIYKWWLTGILAIFFMFSLIYILELNKWYVIIGAFLVTLATVIWPENPLIPFFTAVISLSIILILSPGEGEEWLSESWELAKQILPLLAAGVFVAGFLLGSEDGGMGLIPSEWIVSLVGGNSLMANLFASIVGAFMYFATLTEIPILQGLISGGMGKGPALALLLAGPAVSLPNMLVIRSVIGTQKTLVYVTLVIIMATICGLAYGSFNLTG